MSLAHAVHGEWTKLRTVPSNGWLALAAVACTVALGTALTAAVNTSFCASPTSCDEDTVKLSLSGVWLGQAVVVVLAALAVTNEYGSRMIGATLAAQPGRIIVLAAKSIVVTVVVLAAGTIGTLASLAVGRALLPGNGFTAANGYPALSLADGPTLRAAAGTVLYLALVGLLSVGVGAAVRDTAGAVTGVLTVLYLAPVIAQFVSDPGWSERLQRLAPMTAGLTVQATRGLDRLPIGPWAGLGVLAAYAGAALLIGGLLFRLRDA